MKNGICSKCGVDAVFLRDSTRNELTIPLGLFGAAGTDIYVCANCGYVEIYARSSDLPSIAQKLPRVPRKS